jgi:UDP-2,3-diacylglucosamine pyrophosphatase LpxH
VGLDLSLVIPDTHRPFHDKRAYALMIQVGESLKESLKEICILGDYADFYIVSSHGKDPRLDQLMTEEVNSVNEGLDELDKKFPDVKKIFIEGNHENRLERFIFDRCPELFGVTDLNYLLKFNQRPNWKVIPYDPSQSYKILGSKLRARHEPLAPTPKASAKESMCSIVHGHGHRIEEAYAVGLDGTNHVCFSPGWLGDKRKLAFKYVKKHHQWQLGFAIVWVDTKTRYFYHQKIHILDNYTCIVNGKKFVG